MGSAGSSGSSDARRATQTNESVGNTRILSDFLDEMRVSALSLAKPHDLLFQRCCLFWEFRHTGLLVDTATVSSGGRTLRRLSGSVGVKHATTILATRRQARRSTPSASRHCRAEAVWRATWRWMCCRLLCVEPRGGSGNSRDLGYAQLIKRQHSCSRWSARSARHLVIHDGPTVDLLRRGAED